MADTYETLVSWIKRDITRFSNFDNHFNFVGEQRDLELGPLSTLGFYTDNNSYYIHYNQNYLGCIASSRKPRAGEDWHRGNDLADGKFSEETWRRILGDIVSYELVKIAKKDTPSVLIHG